METIPELLSLDNDVLKDLINSEDKLDAFIDSLPEVSSILNRCKQLSDENFILANQNLELKNNFEKTRDSTLTKVQELATLQTNFEKLNLQHQQLTEKLSPANLQQVSLLAAARSEEESEVIAEEFLHSKEEGSDVNVFIATYLDKRIESYLRKFKGEQLGIQLKELQKAGF